MPIVDYADDPGTARIVDAKAREYPGRVVPCPYPGHLGVHNNSIGLNAAFERWERTGVPFEWVGIADTEDLFHPDLLHVVDYRFRRTNAAVVQCGVQLMNFTADPRAVPPPLDAREHLGVVAGGHGRDAVGRQHGVLPPPVPGGAARAARPVLGREL